MGKITKSTKKILFKFRLLTAYFRKTPDFIIAGTQKGGTSSLYHYLSQHPQISMSTPKEVHYYDFNLKKGLLWYKAHFTFRWSKKLAGEASPFYMFHPHAAKRIYNDMPNIKIILLLRNPVERAFSHYKMNNKNGTEPLSFEEAIDKEKERLFNDRNELENNKDHVVKNYRLYSYVSRGLYDEQIKNWLQYFPLNQILIIRSEEFFENTERVVNEVLNFLHIKKAENINFINKNKGAQSNINETTRKKLETYFAEPNKMLSKITGIDFKW